VGAIPRVTLLAALGNVPPVTRENPIIDLPATVPASEITQTLAAVEQPMAAAPASRPAAPAVAAAPGGRPATGARAMTDARATIEGAAR